jgi:acyl-CoA thioester hydrolase
MPGTSHAIEFRVRYAETDQMRVVYHANYLVWCEMGRTEFIRQVWAPYAESERRGVALAVVEANLRFHAAARYDDVIRVTTTLREVRSRTVTFNYLITNVASGRQLVSASTTLVGFSPSGTVTALPEELRVALESHIA